MKIELPNGIFDGVHPSDQIQMQERARTFIESLPDSAIFGKGKPPKSKPKSGSPFPLVKYHVT